MALFQHDGRSIKYDVHAAPFAHDLILLQGSRLSQDIWWLILEDFRAEQPAGGRVIVAEPMPGISAAHLEQFIKALDLQALHVVAIHDACAVVDQVKKQSPTLVEKALLFPKGPPPDHELQHQVREFCEWDLRLS